MSNPTRTEFLVDGRLRMWFDGFAPVMFGEHVLVNGEVWRVSAVAMHLSPGPAREVVTLSPAPRPHHEPSGRAARAFGSDLPLCRCVAPPDATPVRHAFGSPAWVDAQLAGLRTEGK